MAPAGATKKRENIHTDIGFVGRKTGFTVQTDLARDDNGMENLSAFFSPTSNAGPHNFADDDDDSSMIGEFRPDNEGPESDIDIPSDAPRAHNVTPHDGSATMEMEESTARSVTAVLEARKGINTPARRKSMHSTHATPNLPLSNVTPQSNLSTPAIRRPQLKGTAKASSLQLSKPSDQDEETRNSYGSHKENVPNSMDSRQSDDALVEAPAPRPVSLGARASGLRAAGGRGSSMLVAKSLKQTRQPAISFPPNSDSEVELDEEPTVDDSEMDVIPAPQPKTIQQQVPEKVLAEPNVAEESSQKVKPGRKGKANVSKTTDEVEHAPAKAISDSDKPAPSKRGRKPKAAAISEDVSEAEIPQAAEELDTLETDIQDMEPEEEENITAEPSPPKKGKGVAGRKKKQVATDTEAETESQLLNNTSQKKRGGRPKKIAAPEPEQEPEQEAEPEPEQEPEEEPEPIVQKSKGRPKKSKKQDPPPPDRDVEPQEELAEQSQPENPPERKRGRKRKAETLIPDTEPDTQEPSTAAESTEPTASKKRKGPEQTAANPAAEKPKTSKFETSRVSEGSRPSRSRTAPLQFWKNEKVSYKVAERDQSGRAVTVTADVVRVQETPAAQKKKARPWRPVVVSATEKVSKRSTKRKSKEIRKAIEENSSESEDGESEDDWEKVGKLVGMVKDWNPDQDDDDEDREDDEAEDEIATSRHGIEFKPIFGSDYLFAKTLGKEFMGCGILELQTGASKKLKSSGKMQLVFFILKGRVEAEVNELGFRISSGGQFQVPRGNMYKISNPFKKTARIFFAQACIPDPAREAEAE